jgi:serine/threonine protein kinase
MLGAVGSSDGAPSGDKSERDRSSPDKGSSVTRPATAMSSTGPRKTIAAGSPSEGSGRTPRLVSLWQHPLGEVFGTGDGKRAVMLTMLDRRIGPRDEDLRALRNNAEEIAGLAKASPRPGDEWARIARVIDVRRARDGRIVITTPLFEGLSVLDTLASGRLSLARVIAILRQLCHTLRPLHRVGLHHGALSPASVILVTDEGRKDAARLVDVGVGAVFTGPFGAAQLVEALPLTPEHARGAELTDRSDIYRVGALAHTMLTGKAPFSGDTDEVVMRAHLEQAPPPLTGPAKALAAVVSRCLSKDPADRFPSIDALEVALCQAQVEASFSTVWDDLERPAGAPPPPAKKAPLNGKTIGLAGKSVPPPPRTIGSKPVVTGSAKKPWTAPSAPRTAAPPKAKPASAPGLTPSAPKSSARPPEPEAASRTPTIEVAAAPEPTGPKPSSEPRDPRPASAEQTAQPVEAAKPSRAESASSKDPAEPTSAHEPTSSEDPANLEPVETGRAPAAVVPPTDQPSEEGESLGVDSGHIPNDAQRTEPESAEATLEYRKLEPSSLVPRSTKGKRLPLIVGGVVLGAGALLFAASRGPGESGSEPASESSAPIHSAVQKPNAPAEREVPDDSAEAHDPLIGDDDEPPQATPLDEPEGRRDTPSRVADNAGASDEEETPDEADALDEEDEKDAANEQGSSSGPSPSVPTQSASELAAAGKQARSAGKTDEAISLFRRALAKDSRNLTSLEALGLIYFNKGDYPKAANYLKRAVVLSPKNVEYRTLLGDAFFKLGRYKDARRHYQKAAARGHGPAKTRLDKVEKKLAG